MKFTIIDPGQVRVAQPGEVPHPHGLNPILPNKDQQEFGDQLIDSHPCVLLPSAVSRHSWNLLVNVAKALPLMADIRSERFALDPRLRSGHRVSMDGVMRNTLWHADSYRP